MSASLITGASSGIGEQFAYALARERRDLVLVARREDRLAAVADKARQEGARQVTVIASDLSHREAPGALYARLEADRIPIDILVNNAGFGTRGEFAKLPLDRELEEIDLNVNALVAMTRLFVPAMIAARHGTIINVASTASFQPLPYMAVYAATKAFVVSFTQAIATELAGTGVNVSALCPGPVVTEFQAVAGIEKVRLPPIGVVDAKTVAEDGLRAARRGTAVAISGRVNAVLANVSHLMPKSLVTRIAASMYRPKE
jgi:short-subunit dehydrogenase